ncbi:5'-methylthioadenosine/adenosylhomocysteine nucleosidase [[Clostridium] polysaccharolyticum]|jgi:adenosylhomocysteine nucleosidase|uniref:adenosylhomocysteine nucleosidase n=1 Tax=[Clostridium] polysaccharolyticum TaxID=29364 RepID=A0A1I0DA30_9FIRM|nr:5'-methylthioadenosine/adenosylhomocysteine nucleosidase [[Clostridium] polysaccharolyticum]SET29145.1 adenosylhomocysteine nucleosidase [[Clostridium] polysaccharolyticum]
MSKLGIIGAMDEEVSILKDKLEAKKVETVAQMEFHTGKLEGKEVVIVRSGIGKVNAAVCTQILISQFGVDVVINTGVAGSLRNEINIGDIVLSKDALNHDMDATGFGYAPGMIPRMEVSIFESDEKLLQLAKKINEEVNQDICTFVGRVVSGDQFISSAEKKKFLVNQFQGYCTEMEGAAIAQAAYLNQIPYLVIRAISDKADNSAEMDYSEFERKAIEHTVNLVIGIVKEL